MCKSHFTKGWQERVDADKESGYKIISKDQIITCKLREISHSQMLIINHDA